MAKCCECSKYQGKVTNKSVHYIQAPDSQPSSKKPTVTTGGDLRAK